MTNHQETAAATPLMDATTAGNIPAAKRLRTGDGAVLVKQLEVVESSEQLETTLLTHKQPHAPTSAALPHITDASCGIISYMTPNLPAWSGILKYRYQKRHLLTHPF